MISDQRDERLKLNRSEPVARANGVDLADDVHHPTYIVHTTHEPEVMERSHVRTNSRAGWWQTQTRQRTFPALESQPLQRVYLATGLAT